MGEQLPVETLNSFVNTALPKLGQERQYYSRPERVTDSYEARRHLAPKQETAQGQLRYGQTEFFEYHWSYLMTDNKLRDIVPTFCRLLFRTPGTVPYGLKRVWLIVWLAILLVAGVLAATIASGVVFEEFTLAAVVAVLLGEGIIAAVSLKLLSQVGAVVTRSFVDVVRYLDRSPRSYAVRRSIRKGMVDLLQGIHSKDRYARIVVVAHSLGAFIAYDGMTSLWPNMCKLHSGPISDADADPLPLAGLSDLERAANGVLQHPIVGLTNQQYAELADFRDCQFELWTGLRGQGNPWLITDFVSVGAPMCFADLLYTRTRDEFLDLVKRTEVSSCPPCDVDQTVEGSTATNRRFGWNNRGRTVLGHSALFAVVRWTNIYFPAEKSWRGDWFGGSLRALYGTGILDLPIKGNLPWPRAPGIAHGRYFSYPDATATDDIATVLRGVLDLGMDGELAATIGAPQYLKESDVTL